MAAEDGDHNRQETFEKLKGICVPLMGATLLTPVSVPKVSNLISDLLKALREIDLPVQLTPPLISYIFLPVSTILRRNPPSAIPDSLLEKIFLVMSLLCDAWWWTCETPIWEQIFMLCGAVIGNIESKGKGKDRDDETKHAAAQCLFALLRDRTVSDALQHSTSIERSQARRAELVEYSQSPKFVPILGQTLNSILLATQSPFLNLQYLSLELTYLIVEVYAPDHLVISVLPGVVSAMTKVALGTSSKKGWANGEAVVRALKAMQSIVIRAIADSCCIRDGALSHAESLEALAELTSGARKEESLQQDLPPYATSRTSSWLRGTSSQLHIAINTLSPLLSHPTPAAHVALCQFSSSVLEATPSSLPQTQPLLLSYLLFLSTSDLPSVSVEAQSHLRALFSKQSMTSSTLLPTLMQITKDTLQSLPRLISVSSDPKVEHAAKVITAVALLSSADDGPGIPKISSGIGKLLGLAGGIEKWGWSLISVLELVEPMVTVSHPSASQLMLENDPDVSDVPAFPAPRFRNLTSQSAVEALEKMFFSLGRAAGESSLFSVEWFAELGLSGTSNSVTALWCTCRLLEGVAMVSITSDPRLVPSNNQPKTLERFARTFAKSIAEIWDESTPEENIGEKKAKDDLQDESLIQVEHIQGLRPVSETLNITHSQPSKPSVNQPQPTLHRSLCLQLLAITAGILQSQFPLLFIQTLYPVLHSLTSTESFLSLTALATLKYITIVTSYASPANLLLSNFDYALDSVSRRLTRRWLDIDATKVLVILVRLVGSDVVERAGDVVEECFDRLDDYNDYPIIVQGLIEVLGEVITVILSDIPNEPNGNPKSENSSTEDWGAKAFLRWHHEMKEERADNTNHGRAPRSAWGSNKEEGKGDQEEEVVPPADADAEQSATPIQALTKQIVSRSIYFLTHGSSIIRARILMLLASAAAVLPESALLPSIHSAWSFILNRLSDSEPFVIAAAASLIEALTMHAGGFMYRRIWDDVWPNFQKLLDKLNTADSKSALARRGYGAIGTASAYTTSHRLYRSIIKTMTATIKDVHPHEASLWQVTLSFRRFLSQHAHEELQLCARDLYLAISSRNADVVWLALSATTVDLSPVVFFILEDKWKVESNVDRIFSQLDHQENGYHK